MATTNPNRGKIINFMNGFQGVAPGSKASINLPVNQRVHRLVLQCIAVNYSLATSVIMAASAGGTLATFTPTITNGVITSIAIATAGSGMTPGTYSLVINDVTGTGATATAVVAGGGTVTATPTVTNGGTPSPIDATTFFSSFTQSVNGVNIRDISPDSMMRIVQATGLDVPLGCMYVYYTNPTRNMITDPKLTSWDLFGQSTFQLLMGISSTVVNPGLSGVIEFDYQRNAYAGPDGKLNVFLQPVAQHEYNNAISSGRNDITTIPYNFPITRMWFLGATPNSLTQLEIYQDNNKVMEATNQQLQECYYDYGFRFGNGVSNTGGYFPTSYPGTGTGILPVAINTYPSYNSSILANGLSTTSAAGTSITNNFQRNFSSPKFFDMAYVSDADQRPENALVVQNSLLIRAYSSVAQNLRIVVESLPASYR